MKIGLCNEIRLAMQTLTILFLNKASYLCWNPSKSILVNIAKILLKISQYSWVFSVLFNGIFWFAVSFCFGAENYMLPSANLGTQILEKKGQVLSITSSNANVALFYCQ